MRSKKIRLYRLSLKYKNQSILNKHKNCIPSAFVLLNPTLIPKKGLKKPSPEEPFETRPVFTANRKTQKTSPQVANGRDGKKCTRP